MSKYQKEQFKLDKDNAIKQLKERKVLEEARQK